MTNRSKQEKLDKIKSQIINNKVCEELKNQATQLVFGSGNIDAEVVFIGEAPGKKEDLSGEPFVGAAGKFLDEMLDKVKLKRKDVYITNIVKYRPPENRDPLLEEKEAFLPYLHAQLDTIQPKVIVTLGRHSMNCLLPGLQISKVHGQTNQYENYIVLPLYHPAAALYNGAMRQTLIDDFMRIPELIN